MLRGFSTAWIWSSLACTRSALAAVAFARRDSGLPSGASSAAMRFVTGVMFSWLLRVSGKALTSVSAPRTASTTSGAVVWPGMLMR